MEHPLQPICANWLSKIRKAHEYKDNVFGKFAREASNFFDGPGDYAYSGSKDSIGLSVEDGSDFQKPSFCMSVNKVAEMVQLFGPVLYHKNPNRVVTPREDTALAPEEVGVDNQSAYFLWNLTNQLAAGNTGVQRVRAKLLEAYLNYTPNELGLLDHARMSIDEAIIKGMGVLWTEVETMPDGTKVVGSFHDSVDNLVVDPDADTFEKCWWVAHRCTEPVWKVEKDYGLEPGSLRGNLESWNSAHESDPDRSKQYWRQQGCTSDLVTYWKVYSRMGMGSRMSGVGGSPTSRGVMESMNQVLERYGDHCFLALVENLPYPLNLPPAVLQSAGDDEVARRVAWPIPFWADKCWPFTEVSFHRAPRQSWPISHLKPAMGELKFINWAYSFLASKIRTTCRDFVAILKSSNEEIKSALQHGPDLTIIELDEMNSKISEAVQFLQHPPMNKDIFSIIEAVMEQFERRVGLTDLAFGESARQFRSASEAEIKQGNLRIRPDDMASRVEEAMSEVAKKEAIAARFAIGPRDVLPVLGAQAAFYWGRYVQAGSFAEIVHQLDYRIEAGSTRKPNRERFAQNMTQAIQTLFQPLMQFAFQTGQTDPLNKLVNDWAKSIDLDASGYLFTVPPPPPPAPEQAAQPQE